MPVYALQVRHPHIRDKCTPVPVHNRSSHLQLTLYDTVPTVTTLQATATLPQWGLGASAKLSLKRSAATAAAPAPAPAAAAPAAAAAVWKLDDGDEDEELLDDDALLTAEDKKAGPTVKPGGHGLRCLMWGVVL